MWKIVDESPYYYKVVYFKGYQVFTVDDNILDLSCFLEDLCNAEYSYEEALKISKRLDSLSKICDLQRIKIINRPTILDKEYLRDHV